MKHTGKICCILVYIVLKVFWTIYLYDKVNIWKWYEWYYDLPILMVCLYMGKKYDESKFYSERDTLTKVNNRRYIYKVYPKISKRWQRHQKNISVFLIDVNNFKAANDENGHETGDLILTVVSDVIRNNVRKNDIVARWGGDEFLIITPFLSEHAANQLIERLKNSVKEKGLLDKYGVSISVGFSYYPQHGTELEELIHQADIGMYRDKQQHKLRENINGRSFSFLGQLEKAKSYDVEERLKNSYFLHRNKGDSPEKAISKAMKIVLKEVLSQMEISAKEKFFFHILKLITESDVLAEKYRENLIEAFEKEWENS